MTGGRACTVPCYHMVPRENGLQRVKGKGQGHLARDLI